MEATPDCWKPVFYLLEAEGFTCWLLNARHVKNDLLTELPDVSAAQARCLSQQLIAGMSGRSGLPGWCSLVASPIVTETGHTGLNQSPAFSSLPIFDVSRSEP
jgi:hypothetical protein